MDRDLTILTIQNNKEEIEGALKRMNKDSLNNILYLNCCCHFKIGDKEIKSRTFSSCLHSDDSNVLVFFARDVIYGKEIAQYLDKEKVNYNIVKFAEEDEYYEDEDEENEEFKEIIFVRDASELRNVLAQFRKENNTECTYYSNMDSKLYLNYKIDAEDDCFISGNFFKGCLEFKDKIILFVKKNKLDNSKMEDVRSSLVINGINYNQKGPR